MLQNILEFVDFPKALRDEVVARAKESLGPSSETRLSKWKSHLSSEQVRYIMESAERFGLKI